MTASVPAGAPLPALTGARFVAAAVVVGYHLFRFDRWDAPPALERAVALGPSAVTFFFVLSGFVLTWASTDAGGRVPSAREFLRARLARLLPIHALSLLVVFPIVLGLWRRAHPAGDGDLVGDVAAPGLLVALGLQAWAPTTALAWNPPAWSLSVELGCYALFPWAAPRLLHLPLRAAVAVAGGALGLAFAPGGILWALSVDGFLVDPDVHNPLVDAWRYHPVLRAPEFLVGVVGARAFRAGWRPPAAVRAASLALIVVVAGAVAWGALPSVIAHNGLLAPAFVVLIASLAAATGAWAGAARALSTRTATLLGEASFALYLLHVPLLYWLAAVGQRRGARPLDDPRVALAAGAGCVLIAVVVHLVVERPARRWLRAWLLPQR